ncbi:hypothetical protein ACIPZ5_24860 [Pseudomonas sp. NPDC089428]|uniref:hypothetical protein n=1 Tax=Pseudomonas sp. NPDC089428 TaxID=3364467 RepID=UPI003822F201
MAVNTKSALLTELAKGPRDYGWGAILALGRDTLTALLQNTFSDRLSRNDFIPPIAGSYYLDERQNDQVIFEGLMFGPPSLSFEQASGQSNKVVVQMELIAGRCENWSVAPGTVKHLRRIHRLVPGLGQRLEFTANLVILPLEAPGEKQLQFALDLSSATDPRCKLSSEAAEPMGKFMLKQLMAQSAFKQPFVFMTAVPHCKDAFTIVDVSPITQRAPEGAGTGSSPESDGAALFLLHMSGTTKRGSTPGAMPYLLPRKVDSVAENMGAALLVSKLRGQIATEQTRRICSQLVLPGGQTLDVSDVHHPHDLIGFGGLKASARMAWLSPGLSSIAAGERVTFTTNGAQMYDWQARDISFPRAAGSATDKAYQARPVEESGSAQRVTVVTAKVSEEADAAARSALVIESVEPLTISPRVASWYPNYPDEIVLRASGGSGLKWKLLETEFGTIVYDPNDPREATFKPTRLDNPPFVRVQRIEVSEGDKTGHATIVLFGVGHVLNVKPNPVPRIVPGATQSFSLPEDAPADWRLFGPGEISAKGEYTAPATTDEEASVVVAFDGPFAGAVIIEHQTPAPAQALSLSERWKTLKEFSLRLNNNNRNQVYANRLGQVGIDVILQTHSFKDEHGNEVWDPVDDTELNTLVLLDEANNPVPCLTGDQIGIPEGSPNKWMFTRRRQNKYHYFPVNQGHEVLDPVDETELNSPELLDEANNPVSCLTGDQIGIPKDSQYKYDYIPVNPGHEVEPKDEGVERIPGEDEGRRVVTFFVHSHLAETANFRARFQAHTKKTHYSIDTTVGLGEIQLEGVKPPVTNLELFEFPKQMGKRVASGPGEIVKEDPFNYYHSTTDYWELSGKGFYFVDAKFETYSMVKWESEQLDETFATFTGSAFKPRLPDDTVEIPPGINYQAELQLLAAEPTVNFKGLDYDFKGQEDVTSGAVLFSLERTSNLIYWDDYGGTEYRKVLQDSVLFTVTDNYGNQHDLRLLFTGTIDPRNYLELKKQ